MSASAIIDEGRINENTLKQYQLDGGRHVKEREACGLANEEMKKRKKQAL